MFRPRRGGRQPSIATILLLTELFQAATTSGIPPVTLITIGLQILIFLRIIAVSSNCFNIYFYFFQSLLTSLII